LKKVSTLRRLLAKVIPGAAFDFVDAK